MSVRPRRVPRSISELLQAAPLVAVGVTGAEVSTWSGQLRNARHGRGIAGSAGWNDGLRLDYRHVLAPLRRMYDESGARRGRRPLSEYRHALETLFHEHVHLLASRSANLIEAKESMQVPAVQALEEGVTEAYAFTQLDRFIDDLGIEAVAPGITAVEDEAPETALSPDALAVTNLTGQVAGTASAEALRVMATESPDRKWKALAGFAYAGSGLDGVLPSAQRQAAESRLAEAMRTAYSGHQPAAAAAIACRTETAAIHAELSTGGIPDDRRPPSP